MLPHLSLTIPNRLEFRVRWFCDGGRVHEEPSQSIWNEHLVISSLWWTMTRANLPPAKQDLPKLAHLLRCRLDHAGQPGSLESAECGPVSDSLAWLPGHQLLVQRCILQRSGQVPKARNGEGSWRFQL